MTDLAQKLAALSPEKRKLLEQKLKQQGKQFNAFPLSYAQQRLWFIDQLEPGNPAYNIPFAVRLQGQLNLEAVQKSLQQIVRRHEILRTTFSNFDGKGMQVIHPQGKIHLEQLDISHLNKAEQNEHLQKLIGERTLLSFDLSKGPLGQISLIRLRTEEWILLLVLHHIICDGWSMGVLIREFTQLYQNFSDEKESPLPDLKIQYADFAQWLRNWLAGERREKQLAFWKTQLGSHPPVLTLPTDKPRPAINRGHGASVRKCYSIKLQNGIQQLSLSEQTTSFMTLLAAFNVLLARYAGQEELCVGIPIANRNRAELEDLIGFFVNTLVIRSDLSAALLSFRQFLRQVKETALNAFAHQDLPFEMIVEELQPDRDMSHTPLFQVMFSHQPGSAVKTELPGLSISRVELDNPTSKFDLLLNLAETSQGLEASLDYNTDLFNASTVERMLRHFGILLQAIVDEPDQSIKTIPFLEQEEYQLIIREWNKNTLVYPENQTIARLFEEQVRKNPGNLAAFYEGQSLHFGALNQQSNQLARYLLSLGLKPEDMVGILMDRSVEMIVAIMAILKAGGAYLPLDPTYPEERLEYMLKDSTATFLISREELAGTLAGGTWKMIDWDESATHRSELSDENLSLLIAAENLAYVIYTSGSTGKPKGVMISHRSALNLAENLQQTVYAKHGGKARRISLNAPISFDASVQQIVMLTKGHGLHIIPQEVRSDGQALLNYIVKHQLEIVDCVPAQLRLLIAHGLLTQREWKPLAFLPGGEAIDPASWQAMVHCLEIDFYNMYGPTECTVDSTIFDVRRYEAKPVIGHPVANARFYVLDPALQPCAVGIPGELYIAGAGVGRGYLNLPELTAEKFIPDPFISSGKGGERMYRSGDLVRYLENGVVEFLGRIDHQVKVRGFRIELGEIENALERHPAIKDAVVLVKAFSEDDKRLIAFLVPDEGSLPAVPQLRTFLADQLPDYMVPSRFIVLEKLPLNPSGKVDRRALLESVDLSQEIEKEFVAPRTFTEEMVQKIFSEVLQQPKISITDNFFDLGGHSLLATQVISRIKDNFGTELPLRELFQSPTVEKLAASIQSAQLRQEGIESIPMEPVSRQQKLPLSFAQQRLWFLDQLEPGSPFYNIPSAYRITGNLNIPALQKSMEVMVKRHETLRTTFHTIEGKAYQNINEHIAVEIPQISFENMGAEKQQEKVQKIIFDEARKPFDLQTGPLFRATILGLNAQEYILLLTMHHIMSDAWSMRVFIREIAQLYSGYTEGFDVRLPDNKLQYADFASWQRNWLKDEVLEKQLSYWKRQLSSSHTHLELPIAKPRPAVQTYHGAHVSFELNGDLSEKLRSFTRQQSATMFMTTLAAFNVLLYRYSGQDDINVGCPIANRNQSAIENIIGFFVNTLVIRSDLSGNPSFVELLNRVKETSLGAFAHQDVPFEKLVDVIQPQRDLSHSPLFQVMFLFQNTPMHVQPASEINLEFLEVENNISQFDLTLTLIDNPGNIKAGFEFNTDLFAQSSIERMIRHFMVILEQIIENPEKPISAVRLLDQAEEQKLISEWNQTTIDLPGDLCIHHLFEKKAKETPQAIAVIDAGKSHTYQELDKQSSLLANYLYKQGITPGSAVGICMERSFDLIVGLYAILKAGAAYVPLDPNYPEERLNFMIKDADVKHVLTQKILQDNLPQAGLNLIILDLSREEIEKEGQNSKFNVTVHPEDIAYIIYTSGSTGMPKGVLVPHASVVNHNIAAAKMFALTPDDRVLQFATINFDTAVEEIFPTLNSGATLVLRGPEILLSGHQLLQLIRQEKLSVIDLPTAYWHQMVMEMQESGEALSDSLRLVILGGDKVSPEGFLAWNKLADKKIRFLNTYGPTETTVISAWYEATDADKEWQTPRDLPIGKPIDNTTAYILDQNLMPVPVGIPGELLTGGKALAYGYLGRPDLTAERFIPDPFSSEPGARLYKTGDMVCFNAGGNVEFIGRVDHQVKIRGFRVETGEIESMLNQHPAIKTAIVVAREDTGQTKRLIAYYLVQEESESKDKTYAEDLRAFLSGKLPEYMVPAAFVELEEIPYTPNGKIDTHALPVPDDIRSSMKTQYVAPETDMEKDLAEIIQEILGHKKVGVNDNFFELGGDSILSIQVIAKARQKGIQITPMQMFQYQNIRQLATVASSGPVIQAEQGLVSGKTPLTPIQQWFFDQDFKKPNHWNQSLLFEVKQSLDPALLEKVVAALLSHHDALRFRYTRGNGKIEQQIAGLPDQLQLHLFDLADKDETAQKKFIEKEAAALQAAINLETGPLFKLAYFDAGSQPGRLLFIIHHLAVDGVSWRILLEDFQLGYQQASSGQEITLPAKTTSFKEWAEKLSLFSESEKIKPEVDFWTALGAKPKTEISTDFANTENQENSVESVHDSLSEEETKSLLQDVPPVYNTQINDILLAALASAFARWNGKRSLFINLEGHGREDFITDVDISRTVGWFTSLYPVYLDLKSATGPGEAIKTIKEQLRRIPNKGLGFGILRYLSDDDSNRGQLAGLDHAPITFNYLGQFDQALPRESLFAPAKENKGPEHNAAEKRISLIDISGAIAGNKLSMSFTYSKNLFRKDNIQTFNKIYMEELQKFIRHCKAPEAGGHTASDFNLAKLDDKKLDKVMTQLKKKKLNKKI